MEIASTRVDAAGLEVGRSYVHQRLGRYDPTAALSPSRFDKWFFAGDSPVLATVRRDGDGLVLEVRGPGAATVLEGWARSFPPADGAETFAAADPAVQKLHRLHAGLRVLRQPWMFDVACQCVLQQRVTVAESMRGWRAIARVHGTRAGEALVFPSAARLARLPAWELERLGIDGRRAATMILLARAEVRRPFLHHDHLALRPRLPRLQGIGPWTTGMILGHGAGDPDAVPTGDLHLPHLVSQALAGEPRGSDERMLELLEPYRGHRFRVLRLILAGMRLPRR